MNSNNIKFGLILLCVVLVAVIGWSSVFIVPPGQQALLLKWDGHLIPSGKTAGIQQDWQPGVYFKWPLITRARYFDMRLQSWLFPSITVFAKQAGEISVDTAMMWRIVDVPEYMQTMAGQATQWKLKVQSMVNQWLQQDPNWVVTANQLEKLNAVVKSVGVKIITVHVTQQQLLPAAHDALLSRMKTSLTALAQQYQVKGKEQADQIRAKMRSDEMSLTAGAQKEAVNILAAGRRQVAQIDAKAYHHSPAFYRFYHRMQAYQKTLKNSQTVLVFSMSSPFFKYLNPNIT